MIQLCHNDNGLRQRFTGKILINLIGRQECRVSEAAGRLRIFDRRAVPVWIGRFSFVRLSRDSNTEKCARAIFAMRIIRTSGQKHDKKSILVSNPEKVLYPGGKFTKADVVDYYRRVARFLLPHFRNRPVTLKRYPNGIFGEAFYEKDAPGFTPKWVRTFPVPRREGGPAINYIIVDDVRTLVWAPNMAALELHPFLHRAPDLDRPTHIVFDLDPGEGANILQCAEVAFLLRDVLTRLRLKSLAKVSGSKGIQIYVPLNRAVTYSATQPFARAIAELLENTHPKRVVADMSKNVRVGKVFIDWSQNADHKTTVGVYSLRAKRPRPYVSTPVKWSELTRALRKSDSALLDFQPEEVLKRLSRFGDLFAPIVKLKQKLPREFVSLTTVSPRKASRSLADYRAKRDFERTAEPAPDLPRRSAQGSRRRFVVQKHAASHLHYDFRLEMNGVLKSWAVPKGVPTKENETHSAFQTEDHPIEYLEFEGIIPRGEYGGGTVMVWDIGTYEVVDGNYWKGAIAIFLTGKKLKGQWSLQRIESEDEKAKWFLRKINGPAKAIPAKADDASALTGRTMEKIAGDKSAVWKTHRNGGNEPLPGKKRDKSRGRGAHSPSRPALRAPAFIKPMKATAVTELPESKEWIYEVKWDGYRVLALKHGADVRLMSLKEKNLTSDFPGIAEAVRTIRADTAVIDGEVVALDSKGCPSFQALQNRASSGSKWEIVYYAFDLLNVDGDDWTRKMLSERKEKLRRLLEGSGVRYNSELSGSADSIVRTVQSAGLEGIVAKQQNSLYRAGTRVTSWLKFKIDKSQEFVIGGYKPDAGSFQSILPGYYEGKKLIFAGKVRQGFNPAMRRRLLESMRPLLTTKCPFDNLPSSRKRHFGEGITAEEMKELCWLKPKLVAQISFTEWTNYGLLRHATFKGLRDDKEPRSIVREL
jgi:bifunctional non-homologous end joining protein LigD